MTSRCETPVPSSGDEPIPPSPRESSVLDRTIRHWRPTLAYVVLVIAPVVGLMVILDAGADHLRPAASAVSSTRSLVPASQVVLKLPIFLTQIIVIIAVSRLAGMAMRSFGQPRVVGEMLAGLMLGPSLLGVVSPDAYQWLFPPGTVRFLNALSQIGLVLFMFLVGLEMDIREVFSRGRQALLTSHASIAVPMFLGGILGFYLYRDYSTSEAAFAPFALSWPSP